MARTFKRILVLGIITLAALSAVALATADPSNAVNTNGQQGVKMHTGSAPAAATKRTAPSRTPTAEVLTVRTDANWILQAQLSNGAIANYIDQAQGSPYGAGYAVLGLARAAAVTGDGTYLTAAWRWLNWYATQERSNEYVTDFSITNGVATSTGTEDSTDAYAGMFLVAAQATWQVNQDRDKLAAIAPGIADAVHAIESTQDTDGLTWAKPDWHVKYAMDEAETYAGLRAAATLATALGETSLSDEAQGDADRLQQGFEELWDPSTGAYDWALHGDGYRQPTTWTTLYPDALEQLWPVAFGLVTGSKARTIVSRFASVQTSTWATGDDNYWAVAGWAFQRVGQTSTANTAASSIGGAAQKANFAWPFTTGDAGQLIVLESGGFSAALS